MAPIAAPSTLKDVIFAFRLANPAALCSQCDASRLKSALNEGRDTLLL